MGERPARHSFLWKRKRQEGQERNERILSKECLNGRAREKETAKTKEENSSNSNLHKQIQMSLSKQHLAQHKPLKKKKMPKPKKAGVTTTTPIGQMTGQHGNPTLDMMEITPKMTGTVDLILLPLSN